MALVASGPSFRWGDGRKQAGLMQGVTSLFPFEMRRPVDHGVRWVRADPVYPGVSARIHRTPHFERRV